MKKLLFVLMGLLMIVLTFSSCTSNQRAKQFGGDMIINIPVGQQLINATWKQHNLWYLTIDRPDSIAPNRYTFMEESSWGVWEGSITFIER